MADERRRFTRKGTRRGRAYRVLQGETDLGEVWKNEQRYNLRRLIVIRGWSATTPEGMTLKSGTEARIFDTRNLAAQALWVAHREEQKV